MKRASLLQALLFTLMVISCLGKDTVPPPAPTVDPIRSPTSLSSQTLSGAAEYGSQIHVSRTPSFEDGSVETTADPFSARWSLEVGLEPGINSFEVVARDSSGNESEATVVSIEHVPPTAEAVSLQLDPIVVDAEIGTVTAVAQLHHHEEGVDFSNLQVRFERSMELAGSVEETVDADASGRAEHQFTGLDHPGRGSVTATAIDSQQEQGPRAVAEFVVHAEARDIVSVELELSGNGEGPAPSITIPPETPVTGWVTVRSSTGVVSDPVFALSTDAPGARIEGNMIHDVFRAGSYIVRASVAGTPLVGSAILNVEAGPPADIYLEIPYRSIPAGMPLAYDVRLRDQHGNPAAGEPEITISPDTATVDTTSRTILFHEPGDYQVTATLDALEAIREVTVVASEIGPGPSRVEIVSPADLAVISRRLLASGQQGIRVTLEAEATAGLAELRLQVRGDVSLDLFELLPDAPPDASLEFALPIANQPSLLRLVAAATDTKGRILVSSSSKVLVHEIEPEAEEGYEVRYVAAGRDGGLLSSPKGLVRPGDGRALVANRTPRRVLSVDLASGDVDVFAEVGDGGHLRDVEVFTHAGALDVMVSDSEARRLHRFELNGDFEELRWSEQADRPRGMTYGHDGLLYMADHGDDEIYVYDGPALAEREGEVSEWTTLDCDGELDDPWGVAWSLAGGNQTVLFVTNEGNGRVYRCTSVDGSNENELRIDQGSFSNPRDIVLLRENDLVVANGGTGELIRLWCPATNSCDDRGDWRQEVIVSGLSTPVGLDWDPAERNLLLSDSEARVILMVTGPALQQAPAP